MMLGGLRAPSIVFTGVIKVVIIILSKMANNAQNRSQDIEKLAWHDESLGIQKNYVVIDLWSIKMMFSESLVILGLYLLEFLKVGL